jgi:hypothetical protein
MPLTDHKGILATALLKFFPTAAADHFDIVAYPAGAAGILQSLTEPGSLGTVVRFHGAYLSRSKEMCFVADGAVIFRSKTDWVTALFVYGKESRGL